jgi:hypothetical protein
MMQVVIKMLPDRKQVRIHYFVWDDAGPAQTPSTTTPTALGPLTLGGVRGYIACQRGLKQVTPLVQGDRTTPCVHSAESRAVTCPECRDSPEWKANMAQIAELEGWPDADIREVAAGGVGVTDQEPKVGAGSVPLGGQ